METDWMKYSWDDFFEKTKEKDIVIWGCGQITISRTGLWKGKNRVL